MKYLFFDIECSDGKHVCSFGYVLTDVNFVVLEKRDILMNPEAIFHTGAWSKAKREKNEKDRGITLAYPKEYFLNAPKFPAFYDHIKRLLTDEDTRVIGFACDNDARFIMWATERYKLDFINYTLYDMQRAFREYKELTSQPALEKALEDLSVDVSEHVAHRSDEDAEVTMLIAKGLTERLKISLEDLLSKYPSCEGRVENGKVEFKRVEGSVCDGGRYTGTNITRRNYKIFQSHVRKTKPMRGDLPLKGEKICFSTLFEDKHFSEMIVLIELISKKGGKCVTRASEATIYVEIESNKVCRRLRIIDNQIKAGKNVKKQNINEFLASMGITYAQLLEMGEKFRLAHIGKVLK